MTNIEIAKAAFKQRPDERREMTDAAFRRIANAEIVQRQEKTQRLRQARFAIEAAVGRVGKVAEGVAASK